MLRLLALLPALALVACGDGPEPPYDDPDVETVGAPPPYDEVRDDAADEHGRARYWATWDRDGDGLLDPTEFANGLVDGAWWESIGGGDSVVSQDEFRAAYGGQEWFSDGLYAEWNTDGYDGLTMSEFGLGLFRDWDDDDSGALDESEVEPGFFV